MVLGSSLNHAWDLPWKQSLNLAWPSQARFGLYNGNFLTWNIWLDQVDLNSSQVGFFEQRCPDIKHPKERTKVYNESPKRESGLTFLTIYTNGRSETVTFEVVTNLYQLMIDSVWSFHENVAPFQHKIKIFIPKIKFDRWKVWSSTI